MIPSGFRATTPEEREKKYKLTKICPGGWVMKDAYIGKYAFGAGPPRATERNLMSTEYEKIAASLGGLDLDDVVSLDPDDELLLAKAAKIRADAEATLSRQLRDRVNALKTLTEASVKLEKLTTQQRLWVTTAAGLPPWPETVCSISAALE